MKIQLAKNQYFILRHGQSIKNKKRISAGWPEVFYSPLTEKGKKQIKEAAKKIKKKKINLIFSSDLLRAKQTAEIFADALASGRIAECESILDEQNAVEPMVDMIKSFLAVVPLGTGILWFIIATASKTN